MAAEIIGACFVPPAKAEGKPQGVPLQASCVAEARGTAQVPGT